MSAATGFSFRVNGSQAFALGLSAPFKSTFTVGDSGYYDLYVYGALKGDTTYHQWIEKRWEAPQTGNDRNYKAAIATMVYPVSSNAIRISTIMEGGTKHYVASPPTNPTAPWWEFDSPWLRKTTISYLGGGAATVSTTESSLSGVSNALFGINNAHLGQVIGAPNSCYANYTPRDNGMFHDHQYMYSLHATGPVKSYGMICWDTGAITTPVLPSVCLEAYTWPELTHVGDGRYILIVREYTGARKTKGVFLGSPVSGWEEVLPNAVKGTPLEPINVFGEYLHVEPVWYNYTTGACVLEGVIKDLSTGNYRFAKYNRRDFTDKKWRLVGRVHDIPDTGDLSFSVASYGRGAQSTLRQKLPNMFFSHNEKHGSSLEPLTARKARFANDSGIGVTYTVIT